MEIEQGKKSIKWNGKYCIDLQEFNTGRKGRLKSEKVKKKDLEMNLVQDKK